MHVEQRVGAFEACPIRLSPMFDPVRVVHEDEESRVGLPPHIMGREALERWFAANSGRAQGNVCPLCRSRVVRLEKDAGIERRLANDLRALAAETYSGGENLAHKCVKLLDARLLAALSLHLATGSELLEMFGRASDSGQTPFDLLEAPQSSDQDAWNFLKDLPATVPGDIMLEYSEGSKSLGGSPFWLVRAEMRHRPVQANQSFNEDDGTRDEYFVLCFRKMPASVAATGRAFGGRAPSSSVALAGAGPAANTWGIAVLLLLSPRTTPCPPKIMTSMIEELLIEGRDGETVDENIFEPAIRIRADNASTVFKGRVAARRGLWIGGTRHFDDFVLSGAPGAAALVTYDPQTMSWRARVCNGEGAASAEEVAINQGSTTRISVMPGAEGLVELTPGFTSRRMPSSEHVDALIGMQGPAPTFEEVERLRARLMLVQLRAEVRENPEDEVACYQIDQIGAVVSEYIIGRQEGCALEISQPRVLTLSRSHCVLLLHETDDGGAKLLAYDDGSLAGTTLRGKRLGIGAQQATEIHEGDSLRLGPSVIVHVREVSPLLRLDDHIGLAAFFQRLGEPATSTSLLESRPRRRVTESILSRSFVSTRRQTHPQERAATH